MRAAAWHVCCRAQACSDLEQYSRSGCLLAKGAQRLPCLSWKMLLAGVQRCPCAWPMNFVCLGRLACGLLLPFSQARVAMPLNSLLLLQDTMHPGASAFAAVKPEQPTAQGHGDLQRPQAQHAFSAGAPALSGSLLQLTLG